MKVIGIVGATGLIGISLTRYFMAKGYSVRPICRKRTSSMGEDWCELSKEAVSGLDVLINVSGAPIDRRWTVEYKKEMWESRVGLTNQLRVWIGGLVPDLQPKTWINISAVGIYGDRGDEVITEQSAIADDYLASMCSSWEAAAETDCCRVVTPRIGVVISEDAKFWRRICQIFSLGLGGRLASGMQWFPWLAMDDLLEAFLLIIENDALKGAVNLVSDPPVRNLEFTQLLTKALRRPAIFPVPRVLLRLALGDFADVTLASQRVLSKKLMDTGFKSRWNCLSDCIADLISRKGD